MNATTTTTIPPLVHGERLTREEFERRYHAMPHIKKAELIDGVVGMGSPVSQDRHGGPHLYLNGWLCVYLAATPGVDGGDNSSVRLRGDNEPQPDASLFIRPENGGRVQMEDGYIVGGPELAVEVAASSASSDRGPKLRLYQRSGVSEYVLWLVEEGVLEWYVLHGGQYELLTPRADGVSCSEAFPGLWLDSAALLARNIARVLAVVQQGVATPEHAAFVRRLATP